MPSLDQFPTPVLVDAATGIPPNDHGDSKVTYKTGDPSWIHCDICEEPIPMLNNRLIDSRSTYPLMPYGGQCCPSCYGSKALPARLAFNGGYILMELQQLIEDTDIPKRHPKVAELINGIPRKVIQRILFGDWENFEGILRSEVNLNETHPGWIVTWSDLEREMQFAGGSYVSNSALLKWGDSS